MQSSPRSKDVNLLVTGKDVEPQELHLFWQHPGFSDPKIAALAILGYAQKEVLEYIKAHPRCTQSWIVNATGKAKNKISEIVGKLFHRSLVRKLSGGQLINLP